MDSDRRDNDRRTRLEELLEKVSKDVAEVKTTLFGITGSPELGLIFRVDRDLGKHEDRITALERFRWYLVGLGAAIVAAIEMISRKFFR